MNLSKLAHWSAIGLVASTVFVGAPVLADDEDEDDALELGLPEYGGTGCPEDTVSAVLSDDARSLSVLFDSYVAETEEGVKRSRASCSLAIPLHIPHGLSVSMYQVDYRGFADIPHGGKGQFNAEYFFAGSRGPSTVRTFPSGFSDDFLFRNHVGVEAVVWSRCGSDTIARVNTSITAQKNRAGSPEEAFVAVDSTDVTGEMVFHLRWRTCH
jgi:hypothetical protein